MTLAAKGFAVHFTLFYFFTSLSLFIYFYLFFFNILDEIVKLIGHIFNNALFSYIKYVIPIKLGSHPIQFVPSSRIKLKL